MPAFQARGVARSEVRAKRAAATTEPGYTNRAQNPADQLIRIQQIYGNRAVQRLLHAQLREATAKVAPLIETEGAENAASHLERLAPPGIQRRDAPYIKKVTVHLAPPQSADLEWEGTPPVNATGSDHFTVSTGKGYSDPADPPGTCTRTCCSDPMTQCAPPWNQPSRVGACCTYYGDNFWTGTPEAQHDGGWLWWTPIQPYYSSRAIALHQHTEVTGQPIGHGCVRMEEPNAKRIHDFSNGRRTNVTIDGRAAPVACDDSRRCSPPSTSGARGEIEGAPGQERIGSNMPEAVPGLEGKLS